MNLDVSLPLEELNGLTNGHAWDMNLVLLKEPGATKAQAGDLGEPRHQKETIFLYLFIGI